MSYQSIVMLDEQGMKEVTVKGMNGIDKVMMIRGGEMISRGKRKKKGTLSALKEVLGDGAPATRKYLYVCLFCTAVQCSL